MSCPSLIMAWEESVESGDTVIIRRLDTTKSGALQDRGIVRVTHAWVSLYSDVCSSRIGAPNVDVGVVHHLAGLVINDLDRQSQGKTFLALRDVLSDLLAQDVCRGPVRIIYDLKQYIHVQRGPWSTAGMSMQAPASANSDAGSVVFVTVLLLWWSILETEM